MSAATKPMVLRVTFSFYHLRMKKPPEVVRLSDQIVTSGPFGFPASLTNARNPRCVFRLVAPMLKNQEQYEMRLQGRREKTHTAPRFFSRLLRTPSALFPFP
jgi:hypothetical protein